MLGFKVSGWGSRFPARVRGTKFEVQGPMRESRSKFEVRGPRFGVHGFRSELPGFRFEFQSLDHDPGWESKVPGSRSKVRDSGFWADSDDAQP